MRYRKKNAILEFSTTSVLICSWQCNRPTSLCNRPNAVTTVQIPEMKVHYSVSIQKFLEGTQYLLEWSPVRSPASISFCLTVFETNTLKAAKRVSFSEACMLYRLATLPNWFPSYLGSYYISVTYLPSSPSSSTKESSDLASETHDQEKRNSTPWYRSRIARNHPLFIV